MGKAVFVDTDVIIDFMIDRLPFSIKASEVFALAESGKIKIYVSAVCFNNIFYIGRKVIGKDQTISLLQKLEQLAEILPVTQMVIKQALHTAFKDFEDSIQYYTALQDANVSAIITRNVKDFQLSELPVQTPEEYILQFLQSGQ